MAEASDLQDFVDGADVDSAVFTLRPDYRVLLLAVDGLAPGAGDASSEALLRRAEEAAVALLPTSPPKSCRTSRPGARPTVPSAPSPSAPATVSKP
jgi:hypothetical protein